MIYVPTRTQRLSKKATRRISTQQAQWMCRKTPHQGLFLIIGCGDELRGDGAVGSLVAMTVDSWQLESANAIVVRWFSPELILRLAQTDYVIFIEPCPEENCARTVQIQPVIPNRHAAEITYTEPERYSPQMLMSLTCRVYGNCPRAWSFKIPTERSRYGERLSSTAKTGVDRAIRTIAQFLRTYQ